MTAQSPSAYFASICLHALVVLVGVLAFMLSSRRAAEPPAIFELVAGEGDNYAATEAPALGEPDAPPGETAVSLPKPVVTRRPDPAPEPEPVEPLPPPPEPVSRPAPAPKATAVPKAEPPPNFVRDIKRLSEKRAANIEKKFRTEQKAAADRAKKEAEQQSRRMSKEEFDRLNAGKKAPSGSRRTADVPSVAKGIRGGVSGGSTANTKGGAGGKALERAEMELTDAYIALILQRIRQTMEQANFSDQLSVRVQFTLSASGEISGVSIRESSGSNEFDRAILDAFRTIPNLGPPPNRKAGTFVVNLRMSDES
jgi:colicin import membrane protein